MVHPSTPDQTAVMLRRYLRDGELMTMPRRGRKRRIVLEHVAERFEPGCSYDEPEVNAMLRPTWRDVAALRRYLVDEGLLCRSGGVYRRCGRPVDVDV